MTKFSFDNRTSQDMVIEAVSEALNDGDISLNEIDAAVISNGDSAYNGERQRLFNSVLTSILQKRIPVIRVLAACGGGGAALFTAQKLGFNNVLVVGCEKLVANATKYATDDLLMAAEKRYEQKEGMVFPAQNALVAQDYMMKYGATEKDLALVALKNHENAYLNPKAYFYKRKVTLKQIRDSPILISPLRLFDCSLSVNGAAACIISKDKSDIEIIGSGLCADSLPTFERDDVSTWKATINASETAFKEAGLERSDIDFAEIHDAFTIVELISYEDLGFAKKGQGVNMIRDGTTKIDGKLPVNTCGGLKAKGHPISATGLAQIYEIVKQMRHEAGDRQLVKTKYALAQTIGGAGGSVIVHILKAS